tara:strand:- start:836 stop:1615 length:780 start_codon:yes stop_codon:yes gene_type:complete
MHRTVLLFSIIVLYYTLALWSLFVFDAGMLVSALVLFAVPALALARFTVAPPMVLLSVTVLGAGVAFLLEGIAHMYGLWYSIGIMETRVFNLVPLEMLIVIVFQVVFLALLYEVFFDDGIYSPRSAWQRFGFFAVFSVAVVVLIGIQRYVADSIFLPYSYLWMIGILVGSALAILILHKSLSVPFFDRIIDFSLIAAVPSGIYLFLASANVYKVFGYTQEYIATISFYGQSVPLEEIILLFALPFFIGTVYEVYLDDKL